MTYRDAGLPVAARVADLLGRMTLEEKVGQVNQRLYGWRAWRRTASGSTAPGSTASRFAATEELVAEARRFGGIGAVYGLQRADAWSGQTWDTGVTASDSAELCAEIQRTIVATSRLGIPALFVEEVPHGHQALDGTVLPVALAVASTWDPDLYEQACREVAAEVRARGAHVALVSTLDVLRDPRWGRAEETFGEDPHLAAAFTTATVRGMQGCGAGAPIAPDRLAVVLKHAAGQGATVGGRNWAATELGRRELAEIHLPPVRAAAAAGAAGMMAAYSEVDGLPAAANRWLLTTVIRESLGFRGLIMADGTALDRLLRMTGDPVAAAALALRSGTDLSLWDEVFPHVGAAVTAGLATTADLDAAVGRVLALKFRLGLFDPPVHVAAPPAGEAARLSVEIAARSVTLLHDDAGLLPLRGDTTVAVLGPHADTVAHALGDYTAPQRPGSGVTVAAALRDAGLTVTTAPGADIATGADGAIPAAVDLARDAGVVVLCLGGSSAREDGVSFDVNGAARAGGPASQMTAGEGVDLAGLRLGDGQRELLRRVAATGTPLVVVLVQGRPHVIGAELAAAGACLTVFYPGPALGTVVADVLLGRREATGRLPVSMPRDAASLPVHYNHRDHDWSGYLDAPPGPLLPFGAGGPAGLAVSAPVLSGTVIDVGAPGEITCRVTVSNDGPRDATAVVQLHLRRVTAATWPRSRELRGFRRVPVPAGESVTVELPVGAEQLHAVDEVGRPYLEPGVVEIQTGTSVADLRSARLVLVRGIGAGDRADGAIRDA
ncbi:glycoside hydrolase family 3 N-terminal domain-containing protein [Actinoplanes sp. NBRC 101535]|uniref:glycoside hydrolase family 3 N-terminal domain-containing protein n=1 Tax=Actinoplanes sp. NBRC 101535 TaxID=3032196 RepID=UPI0024A04B07|nr:glycoside hydrolase family 3 N-terminal domain-containing protein [Actinoplanes sp. NBRC 101535]GLY00514.1 beta-glucosidase [Actinoplanes sp. NBRC 101535]